MTSEPTNDERADRALSALAHYCGAGKNLLDESDVTDLLSDLMHLCRREAVNFNLCVQNAQMHYRAERDEDGSSITTEEEA